MRIRKALLKEGDSARSAEMEVTPQLSITIGHRNVYFNLDDGLVYAARIHTVMDDAD